jgi:hypothetical protein
VAIIRRVYVYLLALAGLAMLASGVANLGRILVEVLVGAPAANTASYVREGVAGWGAAALVGLPAWAGHWAWAQRLTRDSADERASVLRRLFLYLALAGAAGAIASAAYDGLEGALELLERDNRSVLAETLATLPRLLVAGVVWAFYWRIAAADRAAVGERGGSATLRRWYVYGLALVGLVMLLDGARTLVRALWEAAAGPGSAGLAALTDGAPGALVGLGAWLFHWRVAPRLLGAAVQQDDSRSTLRSVYLFLGLALGVGGTIFGTSQLLYYGLARLLGVARPGGVGGDLLLAAAGPGSVALIYGVAWLYQRAAIRQESQAAETRRQVGVRRFYTYLVALLGLGALAIGAGGLLWTLGDALTNAPRTATADWWREQVALYATLLLVGLPVWLGHWRTTARIPADEARALTRRLHTYLALIAAALALLGSAAGALYRLLGLALGEAPTSALTGDLAHALAVALVATIVVIYHWQAIRADTRKAAAATALEQGVPTPEIMLVRLSASDSRTLASALATLRERGVSVEQVDA